jgi:hypothetical protein
MVIDRRTFLKASALGTSSFFLPHWSWANASQEPHQLLHIHLPGGVDFTYLFDARPLEMTQANLQHNYMNEEPFVWEGPTNGRRTYATHLTKPLLPYQKDFSIINGIFMDRQFVGHDQLENVMFTGNPFGGEAYMPLLNKYTPQTPTPLDGLKKAEFMFFSASNMGGMLPFGSKSTEALVDKLQKSTTDAQSATFQFIASRMKDIGVGKGQFSLASSRMYEAYMKSVPLSEQLKKTNVSIDPNLNPDLQFLNLFNQLSQQNSIRAGYLSIDSISADGNVFGFDAHDSGTAQSQPIFYKVLVERLASIINYLKTTPFSSQKSLLDVTTVVISTEFGRTMRQEFATIDATGTDHNPYCNSILVAGKGIRGGMVIGESDFKTSSENLSGAHLQIDPKKINLVGRVFDFEKQAVVLDQPPVFDAHHYLNIGSVMNTFFDIFSLEKSYYRKLGNGAAAQVLPSLTTLLK